jgi:hypothetical protein
MLESATSKRIIAVRRDIRNRKRDGYEYLGEGGGKIWELYRGCRYNHVITEAIIAVDGKGVWVKTAPRP